MTALPLIMVYTVLRSTLDCCLRATNSIPKRAELPDPSSRSRLTAATLGEEGVLAWDGKQFHYASAFCVQTVDTTGAGDIFHAGFIFGLLQGWPLQRQLDFACAAAALNCTAIGARGGIQSVASIEQLIATGARHARAYDTSSLT